MTTLRMLSWNVRGLRDDVDAIVDTVAEAAPHLVVIQEAPRMFRWRSRNAELARRCGMVVAAGGGDARGNLLICNVAVRVHATRCVHLPLTPGEQLRGAALARCSLAGAEFTLVGTHLSLNPAERARQVPHLLTEIGEGGAPLVLAGDLNERPGGPVWATLSERLEDVAAAVGDGSPTYSSDRPRRRIDAIFIDPRIVVERYAVPRTAATGRASDHLPLYAELKLP